MRRTKISTSCLYIFICLPILAFAQKAKDESAVKAIASKVWVSDQGDGIYINPIIHADYSDSGKSLAEGRGERRCHVPVFYSENGEEYKPIGKPFKAREARWIGAKVGLFAVASQETGLKGHADFDYFLIEPVSNTQLKMGQ